MKRLRSPLLFALFAIALMAGLTAQATTVLKMDLGELCDHADSIFRGTVVSTHAGTVMAGGIEMPTVTYRLQVREDFKGSFGIVDGNKIAEVTMLGTTRSKPRQVGGLLLFSALPELPKLNVGQEYLLMTSAPSTLGLSTTIGLGQGCFDIKNHGSQETAVNQIGNAGLFDGPVNYQDLAAQIRAAVAQ